MEKQPWSQERILKDLEKLKSKGAKPNPYELKTKYGYLRNSEFFPILEAIRTTKHEMRQFIDEIFNRVLDHRDLIFRFGECHCSCCRE